MASKFHGRRLGAALLAEGLIPANARLLELVVPADGAVLLRFECFVEAADLGKLIRAMQALVVDEQNQTPT